MCLGVEIYRRTDVLHGQLESGEYGWQSSEGSLISKFGPSKALLAPTRGVLQEHSRNPAPCTSANKTSGMPEEPR